MKVVIGYPKNWDKIKARFKLLDDKFLLTLGDTLYNPSNLVIEESYWVHEETHSRRQLAIGLEKYVQRYFNEPVFRFVEELRAYKNQWLYIVNHGGPHIDQLARELCNPSYGFELEFEDAKNLILGL